MVAVGFAGAAFFLAWSFSFDAAATEVEPVAVPVLVAPVADEAPALASLEDCCEQIAQDGGLTGREAQMLGFLARGRNVACT